jgi:L-alanine-DL-glutamate epimerase-like enolase superfamily enzyme
MRASPTAVRVDVPVERIEVGAYRIPTDFPESDGTLEWDSTTLILVEIFAGDARGQGYTYADESTARLIYSTLSHVVLARTAMDVPECWAAMRSAIRNLGRPGIASMAIAAVDVALWDLKAKLLHLPLVTLLGGLRDSVPVYGSGGFTSYSPDRLAAQFENWMASGIMRMKMKIGRDSDHDRDRVRMARHAIGPEAQLFVDANGAFTRKQALKFAEDVADADVSWFEEPVSSDDLEGLRLLRDRVPAGMAIAAGEYGYDLPYFRRMLEAGAVDVLQADATRCAGITEFMRVAALCDAFGLPLSAHTAPALHLHPCLAAPRVCHIEYFHDHARIEAMLFDGAVAPVHGALAADLTRPGLGVELKLADAERYRI